MTKFLDTYETWDKIFKIIQDNNQQYKIYVHDNCWLSPRMGMITLDKKELLGLIDFLQEFLNNE